jgi:hypothetical protein
MPTRVDVPGVGLVEFPDGMSDDQISAAIQKSLAPPSRSATFGNAVMKGAAGFADMIPNAIVNTANLGIAGYGAIKGALGAKGSELPDPINPQALSGFHKIGEATGLIKKERDPTDATGRVVDVVGQVIGGGGINPAAVGRALARGNVLPVVRDVVAATAGGTGAGLTSEAVRDIKTGNDTVDRLIRVVAPMAGGMAASSAVASRGTAGDRTSAALSGVTSEQLQLAKALQQKANAAGTPLTGYEAIQAVTGLNPKMQAQQRVTEQSDAASKAGLTSMMQRRPENNAVVAENAISGVSPKEPFPDVLAGTLRQTAEKAIADAQAKRTEAVRPNYQEQRNSDMGAIKLTEAIPSIEARVADRLASRADARQQTGQIIGRENEMRIGAENAVPVPGQPRFPPRYTNQNDRAIEAGKAIPDFDAVAKRRAAEVAEAERTLGVAQDALASKNLPYIQGKVNGFLKALDENIKLAGPTREGDILRALRKELAPEGAPVVLPTQLESIYKANRDKLDTNIMSSAEDKTRAAVLGGHVRKLDALIQEVSPAIREGRAKYAQISKEVVDPLINSQVGKLTRSDEFQTQAGTLLPEKPMDVTPSVLDRTIKQLNQQDPEITRRFLAQYLRGTFNESNGGGVGNNAFGGYQFAKKVADNPVQKENLIQALKSSGANPAPVVDALDIFRAQGMKPPVNSATTANAAEAAAMSQKKLIDALLHPVAVAPGYLAGKTDLWRNGMATKEMAKALADPNSVERLAELARANGTYSPLTQQMLAQMLLASRANSTTQQAGQ